VDGAQDAQLLAPTVDLHRDQHRRALPDLAVQAVTPQAVHHQEIALAQQIQALLGHGGGQRLEGAGHLGREIP